MIKLMGDKGISAGYLLVALVAVVGVVSATFFVTGNLKLSLNSNQASTSPKPGGSQFTAVTSTEEVLTDIKNEVQKNIASSSAPQTASGKVGGKLCYPSEVLLPGILEAKRISDSKVTTQNYPGSMSGGGNIYSFDLEEGEYVLRYKVSDSLIGYSTTICPTGNETTCGDAKKRELIVAKVMPGGKITNYDLCDFYYSSSNVPTF